MGVISNYHLVLPDAMRSVSILAKNAQIKKRHRTNPD